MASHFLILHGLRTDSRQTTINHTLSFARYMRGHHVVYANGLGVLPPSLGEMRFDAVVMTYELLAMRTSPLWPRLVERISPLLRDSAVRIAMPQDDFTASNLLDDFIVDEGIDIVLTPVIQGVGHLYPRAHRRGVTFHEVLTGYWEPSLSATIDLFKRPWADRSIDLGQRLRGLPASFGRGGQLKARLTQDLARSASAAGLRVDVSIDESQALLGDRWWELLGNSRFTTGVRGGATLANPWGPKASRAAVWQTHRSLRTLMRHTAGHPASSVAGDFTAISPRLFEAAAAGTCQIMPTDHYVDGMVPWQHYIPLEAGLSSIDEVISAMKDLSLGSTVAENAASLLVGSQRFTYESFVRFVASLVATLGAGSSPTEPGQAIEVLDVDDEVLAQGRPWIGMEERRQVAFEYVRGQTSNERRVRANRSTWIKALDTEAIDPVFLHIPWCSAVSQVRRDT